MNAQQDYALFLKLCADIARAQALQDLLIWDARAVPQPEGSEYRSGLDAHQAGLLHAACTAPEYMDCVLRLEDARQAGSLDTLQAANVAYAARTLKRRRRIPRELVEETAAASSDAQTAWAQARKSGDDAKLITALRHLVSLKRQEGALHDAESPYDGLLPEFEPGITSAEIGALFEGLRKPLQTLLHEVHQSEGEPLHFSHQDQERLARVLAERMGFQGRLDIVTSSHPFMIRIHPGATRCVIRYADDAHRIVRATTHEIGHGLYEQAIPASHFGTGAGTYSSLGLHESQSRLWEVYVFGSRPGNGLLHTLMADLPGVTVPDVETLYRRANAVSPSLIRVEADPLHYLLHIFLRVDLERALIEGRLEVENLPAAWNAAIKESFGLEVPHVAQGYGQDPHWAGGSFGYFPTYALGMLYAAQLWAALQRDIPALDTLIAQGNFADMHAWLNEQVWRHGAMLSARAIIERATGTPPDSVHFLRLSKARLSAPSS